ncbi:MAG: YcxB family protein, partial [Verrucomicrobia bacterium]|nr:YcxB family protein [Verrucomicrobiota bacterium]
ASPPSWAGKIKWSEIESIKQGEFGIHIYKNGRVFYSVPKNALPMDLPADELVRSWSLFMAQSKATTQI